MTFNIDFDITPQEALLLAKKLGYEPKIKNPVPEPESVIIKGNVVNQTSIDNYKAFINNPLTIENFVSEKVLEWIRKELE